MFMLFLQIALLMLAAYFVGAALACGLRKVIRPRRSITAIEAPMAPRAVDPLPQVARATDPAVVSRFEKALTSEPPRPAPAAAATPPPPRPAPAAAKPAAVASPPQPVARAPHAPVEAPAPHPALELVVPPPPRINLTSPPLPEPAKLEPAKPVSAAAAGVAAGLAAAAAAAVAAKAAQSASAAPAAVTTVTEPVVPAAKPVSTAPPVDDLTRIRGIDAATAAALGKLGVTRYSQIAAWMRPDVTKVNQALGFKARVEKENWIEQAQILAGPNQTTLYARLRHQGFTTAGPAVVAAIAPVGAVVAPAVKPVAAIPAAVALKPAAAAAAPAAKPVAPAAASPASAASPATPVAAAAPPVPKPIAIPANVEQRAAFAEVRPAATAVSPAPAPARAPAPATATAPAPAPAPVAPAVAAAAKPASLAPNAPPLPVAQSVRPDMAPTRDQLQRISGINAEIEKLLNVQGVTRYGQIAGWGTPEADRFDRLLGSPGRVRRESWIEQAQMLVKGGGTSGAKAVAVAALPAGGAALSAVAAAAAAAAASAAAKPATVGPAAAAVVAAVAPAAAAASAAAKPAAVAPVAAAVVAAPAPAAAPAAAPRADISALRSVKSEAFASTAGANRGGAPDDLKRIRGVGVLIEKRLNALGVTGYEQVANWTADDIARFSQQLDFKGRIERENWVEQARILASGGFTEFSRRVDRGEVETSRPKV